MMNLNLAGILWSLALFIATKNFKGRLILSALLLILSALSYEAFIPLFALNIFIALTSLNLEQIDRKQVFLQASPVITALLLFGVYRAVLERLIFNTTFSRVTIHHPAAWAHKFFESMFLGLKIALLDSLRISIRSLPNITLLSLSDKIIILIVLTVIGFYVYKAISVNGPDVPGGFHFTVAYFERFTTIRLSGFPLLDLCSITVFIFFFSHAIYLFSEYSPLSWGFENRTLGAIRYATALLLTAFATMLYRVFINRWPKRAVAIGIIGLATLFTLSMVGQREAWIAAARYNTQTIHAINTAIEKFGLAKLQSFVLVARLPDNFPGQVNREPILGVSWDIGPLLSLSHPEINIRANVYDPSRTAVGADKITIAGYWEAQYPFYFYDDREQRIYQIASDRDWQRLHSASP